MPNARRSVLPESGALCKFWAGGCLGQSAGLSCCTTDNKKLNWKARSQLYLARWVMIWMKIETSSNLRIEETKNDIQLDLDRNRKLETILQRRLRFSFIGIEKYFYFKQIAGACYLIWEKSMHTWWIIELWAVWMDSTVTHKLHVVIILGISTIFFWLELTLHDLGLFWYVRQFSIC